MARPRLGLYAHSNLARRYAAYERDHPLGRANAKSEQHYVNAVQAQAIHWAAVTAHVVNQPSRVEIT